ncbi:MAG: glycerol-3-phosphate 1-O-acyltransferase PlsY [Candidatus Aminicenantes bacterium]|nr:glycerol-3-phosphate 1-O-acyltransferase PlsY [Candidatus Aminicenantes bacterium]
MKIIFLVASYLLGAIPTGYLLVKLTTRRDIREVGSGSTGATNVLRYKGWRLAIPVMLVDILKGFLPALLASVYLQDRTLALLGVLAAVIGHCYPVYLKFRGGKGVATSVGGFLYLASLPLLLSLVVMVVLLLIFRYVSLATITGLFLFPLFVLILYKDYNLFLIGLLTFLIVVIRHKENIRRLLAGTERKFGERVDG